MYILGVSAFYHDSAACLVKDGEILAAAQEERFTRQKHDPSFPHNAVDYCLKEGGIEIKDLDFISFYDKPFLKFERILSTYVSFAPRGLRSFLKAVPLWIKQKLWIKDILISKLGYNGKVIFPEHHQSHAASAFFPSPFQEAAFLTVDGVGEWATASFGLGRDNSLEILSEINFPHSLGLLYSAFTYFTGFKVNSGEYKVMGLAPYGEPVYKDLILQELIDLKPDGSFRLNLKYFNFCTGLTMTNRKFQKLFGVKRRIPETEIRKADMDLARSVQEVTEEVLLKMADYVYKETGKENLCLAGGVALNCVANGKILKKSPFKNIWIQPAASDAGGALGAALFVWYQYLQEQRVVNKGRDFQRASFLGPEFSAEQIRGFLNKEKVKYEQLQRGRLFDTVADLIAEGKVIGVFQGRMEFGPRALGCRSIVADARSSQMRDIINSKVKFREGFRPFAPAVIKEYASEYFDAEFQSPYMLLTSKVLKPGIPAVTHVDNSARLQTVDKQNNPFFYNLIKSFYQRHGCPVVVNTSFNRRGEPIVCTPEEAYRCFRNSGMDYLLMGDCLVGRS